MITEIEAEYAAWQKALKSDDTDEWHFTATALAERIPELLAALKDARRERDEAITHDRQPYPTAWAYERAVKTIERMRPVVKAAVAFKRAAAVDGFDGCHVSFGAGFVVAVNEYEASGEPLSRRPLDAEATISFTRDLLDVLDKDGLRHDRGGRIWLDSAGEHEYTFHRNEASLKGFRHDVLIYQRVHRGKCYETSPSECGGCECWCHAESGGAASVASADTTGADSIPLSEQAVYHLSEQHPECRTHPTPKEPRGDGSL